MANEKRLISESDRANLIRCLKKLHDLQFTPGIYEHSVIGRAALFLEETANAVEVVRCKDCKHWLKDVAGCTDFVGRCEWANYMVGAVGYCVYGERRTDDLP